MAFFSRRLLCSLLTLSALSGCANLSPASNATHSQHAELEQYLNSTNNGAFALNNSPWGNNVTVIADSPYFAASGHQCRQIAIEQASGSSKQKIACRVNNHWQFTRLLNPAH